MEQLTQLNRKKGFQLTNILGQYGALIILIGTVVVFSLLNENFLTYANFSDILRSISIVTFIAIGVTFSLIIDGLDLSVGSTASLSTVVSAILLVWFRQELLIVIIVPIIIGIGLGYVNGLLITKTKIQDLLVTLATMYIINGIHLTITKGSSIYEGMRLEDGSATTGIFIPSFLWLGQGNIFNIPVPVVLMFITVAVMHLFLEKTTYGRIYYFIGGNRQAAELSGIPTNRYRTYAYMLSGLFAAIGGIILASRVGTGQVSAGTPLLMDSITAAYIGIALYGKGKPNMIGTFLGACFMGVMLNGLTMLNVPYFAQDIVKGGLLISSVLIAKRK